LKTKDEHFSRSFSSIATASLQYDSFKAPPVLQPMKERTIHRYTPPDHQHQERVKATHLHALCKDRITVGLLTREGEWCLMLMVSHQDNHKFLDVDA